MASLEHISSVDDFKAACAKHRVLIIDAFADWCGPCKQIAPVFEALAAAAPPGVGFYKMDVDAAQELASLLNVSSLPTFLLIVGGQVRDTVIGANRSKLEALVKAAFTSSAPPA